MNIMRFRFLGSIVFLCTTAACLDIGSPSEQAASNGEETILGGDGDIVTISMSNLAFIPDEITIAVGTTVRWVMQDAGTFHFVSEGAPSDNTHDFESPQLDPGDTWDFIFSVPGDFIYFCPNHSTIMRNAMIHVR